MTPSRSSISGEGGRLVGGTQILAGERSRLRRVWYFRTKRLRREQSLPSGLRTFLIIWLAFIALAVCTPTNAAPQAIVKPGTAIAASQPLTPLKSIPLPSVKGGFDLMAADVAGQRLFVDAEDNNTTEVLDLSQNRLVHEITGMHTPKWVVYRPELNRLYIANGNGVVQVLNATTFRLLHSVTFREKANNLHFDPTTGELFVGVGEKFGAIGVIDTKTDDRIAELIPLANSPNQFELDGDLIFVNVPESSHVAVIDRKKHKVVATWPVVGANDNLPMNFDRKHHRLFIGFAFGKFAVLNSVTGKQVAALNIGRNADGIYYDEMRRLIYISCGEGWIYVIRQSDADHYATVSRIETAKGAGTSLFVSALNRLFLAVPRQGSRPAEIRVFATAAGNRPSR